jgi:hypothetical protein
LGIAFSPFYNWEVSPLEVAITLQEDVMAFLVVVVTHMVVGAAHPKVVTTHQAMGVFHLAKKVVQLMKMAS